MEYWDRQWANHDVSDFRKYIDLERDYIFSDHFRANNVKTVCDIGCGFGKYSVISAFHGFEVYGIDISDHAVKLTENMLKSFGLDFKEFRVCKMSEILFDDNFFDGVIAHAVIDHMKLTDAKKSIYEISRITRPGGIVYVSFDGLGDEDLSCEHDTLDDGSMMYKTGERDGLIFRYYTDDEIRQLLSGFKILLFETNSRGEREVIFKNQ